MFPLKCLKVKDLDANRYSYTDYYDNTAVQGKKGPMYKVYDEARTVFVETCRLHP
jgi:hypothetical protein